LSSSQVASFFSRQSAAVRQSDPDEMDFQAALEQNKFSQAKETVETVQLQHPLVYYHYDLCAMALRKTLKQLKLPTLQRVPGPRCASPTCAQKGSILGASRGHY